MAYSKTKLKAILNKHWSESPDNCGCGNCQKMVKEAVANNWKCKTCGFGGIPDTLGCACYDSFCRGVGANSSGAGCPHGWIYCPVCDEGEGETSAWDIIKEIRELLAEEKA